VSDLTFTGERLHEDDALFGVDLAQHRAAYRFVLERADGGRVLELGSGTGYGAAELAQGGLGVVAVDRVAPLAAARSAGVRFVRADLNALPLRADSFDRVVSFQVIEHLDDPMVYLASMARLLTPGGEAIVTTPNVLTSLGVNPYHVHEYRADELGRLLGAFFEQVEIRGVGATEPVRRYLEARSVRIRRIMRIDPLGVRNLLPRAWIERLFAWFAVVVRRGVQRDDAMPEVTWRDFPISRAEIEGEGASDDCVDLLAVCRRPRSLS